MSCTGQCNLAHWSPLSAARLIAANGASLLRELRPISATTSVLSYDLGLLLFHLFVLLAKLGQIKLHDILNKTVQLILIMLQLCDIDNVLLLQIGKDYIGIVIIKVNYILSGFPISHLLAPH